MSKRGFTLIELLIVIGIIAVLSAILFPAFAKVRGKARQINCMSNLRQLGMAMSVYVTDWDSAYPYDLRPRSSAAPGAGPAYDGTNKWDSSPIIRALAPYVHSDDLPFCPDRPRKMPDLGTLSNYEFNGFIALNDSPLAPHSGPVLVSDVVNSAEVLLFEDYGTGVESHAGYRNFVLCDGGARAYPAKMQGAPPCHAKWWL